MQADACMPHAGRKRGMFVACVPAEGHGLRTIPWNVFTIQVQPLPPARASMGQPCERAGAHGDPSWQDRRPGPAPPDEPLWCTGACMTLHQASYAVTRQQHWHEPHTQTPDDCSVSPSYLLVMSFRSTRTHPVGTGMVCSSRLSEACEGACCLYSSASSAAASHECMEASPHVCAGVSLHLSAR